MENNSEEATPGPCIVCPSSVKSEKVESSVEESQDRKAEKELVQFAKPLKHKRITSGYIQTDVGDSPWAFSLESCSAALRPCSSASACVSCGSCWRSVWRKPAIMRTCRRYAVTRVQARKRKLTSVENRVRENLENKSLQYPKSTLQQIRAIAKQLGWRKTWSECGSATCARRANDQALTIPSVPVTALGSAVHSN